MPEIHASDLLIDLRANTLSIRVPWPDTPAGIGRIECGTLDIGANGRLLGLELGTLYVSVMDMEPGRDDLVRSAEVPVTISAGSGDESMMVTFRRRGADYEITYPSGNQCWTRHNATDSNGLPLRACATVIAGP